MSARTVAVVTLGVLLVALGVALAILVPWGTVRSVSDGVHPDASLDFTPQQIATGDRLARLLVIPGLSATALSLLLALILGLSPLGPRVVEWVAQPFGGAWYWQALLGGLALLVLGRLVTLPFSAWAEQVRRDNGLSTQHWSGWALDVAKSFGVASVLTLGALFAIVALARKWPSGWWAPASLGAAVLVVAVSFLYPLVVEPLFNSFTPMPDSPLRTRLLELAQRDGVAVDDVLVADASTRTTTLNAYVSGIGSTRRIVVYDTLLDQAPDREIEEVVAHELGHVKTHDVVIGTMLGAMGAAAVVICLYLLVQVIPLGRLTGVDDLGDGRSVAFLLAFIAVVGFVGLPIQNVVSRNIEARADLNALNLTSNAQTFAEMQRRLAVTAKADVTPNPLLFTWFGSHPSTAQRLAMARGWAAEHGAIVPAPLADSDTAS